ncbi:calmodulin-like protein 3 [Morus notabilis]|uniref:calmodulin-like protein 3 n=1 Tax=Morus notabilis TaxID=981085 RepID=UPI000CED0488|nr:calmodulin-like protein 3 [Morus notabilis]
MASFVSKFFSTNAHPPNKQDPPLSLSPLSSFSLSVYSLQMPTILPRIFLIYNLLNSFFRFLVPKKLIPFLPSSWFSHQLPSPPSSPPSSRSHQRRMSQTELNRVFQMFDRNGDGHITKKELGDSLENLGIFIPDKELSQMIDKIDADGDGCVDISEFGELYRSIMDERNEERDMKEAFDVFDQNGDGFITVDELRSVLASLGLKQGRTVEDCKRMIMKVDVDGDGMVNYKEFREMMKGGGFSALS